MKPSYLSSSKLLVYSSICSKEALKVKLAAFVWSNILEAEVSIVDSPIYLFFDLCILSSSSLFLSMLLKVSNFCLPTRLDVRACWLDFSDSGNMPYSASLLDSF